MAEAATLHKTDRKILEGIHFRVTDAFTAEMCREFRRRNIAVRIPEDEHRPALIDGQKSPPEDSFCVLLATEFHRNREGSVTIVEYYRWLRARQKELRLSNADVAYIVERAAFHIAPVYMNAMYKDEATPCEDSEMVIVAIAVTPSPEDTAKGLREDLMRTPL